MFWQTYKNTFKNVFRSSLFLVLFVTVVGLVVHNSMSVHYGVYDPTVKKIIYDNEPEWVYTYSRYVVSITQLIYPHILTYITPVFTVVTAFLVAGRDYADGFYEIEKAGGMKAAKYYFGRISALFTVAGMAFILFGMLSFHLYTFTRGMVEGMTPVEYLVDSNLRIMRVMICGGLPCVLFYVTLTYMLGCLFRSGAGAAVGGVSLAMVHYFCTVYMHLRFPRGFDKYLPPLPRAVEHYLYNYGEPEFEDFVTYVFGVTREQAVTAAFITVACSVAFMAVSYVCVMKKTR